MKTEKWVGSGFANRIAMLAIVGLLIAAPRFRLQGQTEWAGYFIQGTDGHRLLKVDERAGTVTVTVARGGNIQGAGTVHYFLASRIPDSTQLGSATSGLDYLPAEGTLEFGPTETAKTFSITILDDPLIEGYESFFVVLDQATGDTPIAMPEVEVVIRDGQRNQMRVDPDFKPDWPVLSRLCVPQPDGRILLVTSTDRLDGSDGNRVLRLLPDGREDPAWRAPTVGGGIGALLVLPNGKVVLNASGVSGPDFSVDGAIRRHLARLNADGSLDTDYIARLPDNLYVRSVALQADGKVLVAMVELGQAKGILLRLQDTGEPDANFKSLVSENMDAYYDLHPTPDGIILIPTFADSALIRLGMDGGRDAAFTTPAGSRLATVLPDGRLMVFLEDHDGMSLVRLTASGQLDPTFSALAVRPSYRPNVLPAMGGKLWLLSQTPENTHSLARRNADGSEDASFPPGYIRGIVSIGNNAKVVTEPDGNLLVVGVPYGEVNGQRRRSLARLLVDAPLPRLEAEWAGAVVPENGGKVRVALLRCGTNAEPIGLEWRTEGGTAKPGVDYVPANGIVTFPANESTAVIELEMLDNALPDEDRTVRLHLQGPLPEHRDFPFVEITIANDDLGFPPDGIRRFPNGRVLLRPTGYTLGPPSWGDLIRGYSVLDASDDLIGWSEFGSVHSGSPEWIERAAPLNSARFFRVRKDRR